MPRRFAYWLFGFASAVFCLGWAPVPNALLAHYESAYSRPVDDLNGYVGVVVLGGNGRQSYVGISREQLHLFRVTDRMVRAVMLARDHSHYKVLYTNGSSTVPRTSDVSKSKLSQSTRFFLESGIAEDQLLLERAATSTRENATLSASLPGVDIKRRWLLVTSAAHMPRAMAVFSKTGWSVTAYPVDYLTRSSIPWWYFSVAEGAALWQNLAYESLAWLEYWVRGWI